MVLAAGRKCCAGGFEREGQTACVRFSPSVHAREGSTRFRNGSIVCIRDEAPDRLDEVMQGHQPATAQLILITELAPAGRFREAVVHAVDRFLEGFALPIADEHSLPRLPHPSALRAKGIDEARQLLISRHPANEGAFAVRIALRK